GARRRLSVTTMMYEKRHQPLISGVCFLFRLAWHFLLSTLVIFVSLAMGVLGYHHLEGLSWLDSLLNASMILGGMGPVDQLHTDGGKLFASFFALYSGLIFLVAGGIILAPAMHRMLHHFHLERHPERDDSLEQAKEKA